MQSISKKKKPTKTNRLWIRRVTSVPTNRYTSLICASRIHELNRYSCPWFKQKKIPADKRLRRRTLEVFALLIMVLSIMTIDSTPPPPLYRRQFLCCRFNRGIFVLTLCFHSRGQHLCKFIGTKESVYIRKEINSHRTSRTQTWPPFHCFGTQIWSP